MLITYQTIEALQASQVPVTVYYDDGYSESFTPRLTDSDSPLDLLAIATGNWTENDLIDNNHDYVYYSFAIDNMEFETAFIASLSQGEKDNFKTNIEGYRLDLARFEKEETEAYNDNGEFNNETLQSELQKYESDAYDSLFNEYLYGDRYEAGVLRRIEKALNISLEYDKKTGNCTIKRTEESYEENIKEVFDNIAYKAKKATIKEMQDRRRQRIEYKKKQEKKEADAITYKEWENNDILSKLSK